MRFCRSASICSRMVVRLASICAVVAADVAAICAWMSALAALIVASVVSFPAVIVFWVASRVLRKPKMATVTVQATPTSTPTTPLAAAIHAASTWGFMMGDVSRSWEMWSWVMSINPQPTPPLPGRLPAINAGRPSPPGKKVHSALSRS